MPIRDYVKQCYRSQVKPRCLDQIKPGGLGTHFINEIMDEVSYCTERAKGTLLTMVKKLKSELTSAQEKNKEGTEHILKAIDMEPENPAYLEALGGELERSSKLLEAANMMERVSILEPDRFEIHVRLGDIYKKKKMYQEALIRYWSALTVKIDESYIHRSVLEIYKTLSDLEIEKLKKLEGQNSFAQTH